MFVSVKHASADPDKSLDKQEVLATTKRSQPINFSVNITGIGDSTMDMAVLERQYKAYSKFHFGKSQGGGGSSSTGGGGGSSGEVPHITSRVPGFPSSQLEHILESRLLMAPDKENEPTSFMCDMLARSSYGRKWRKAADGRAMLYMQYSNSSRFTGPNLFAPGAKVPPLGLLLRLGTASTFRDAGAMLTSYIDRGGKCPLAHPWMAWNDALTYIARWTYCCTPNGAGITCVWLRTTDCAASTT